MNAAQRIVNSPRTEAEAPDGLLDAHGVLKAIFPDESSRPSLRWLRKMTALRAIPVVRINRLVFFSAERVKYALRSKYEVEAL